MSKGSAQILQYAKETTVGVTPTTFARQTIAFTDQSLNQTAEKTESASITDGRIQQASMITSSEYTGDISCEAQYGAYDDFIAAAAFNKWETDKLTFGGDLRQTISMLLGYKDIKNYHTFAGLHVNTFGIEIPETGLITFSFGFMGMKRTVAATAPTGTITNASTNPKLSNISVGELLVNGLSVKGKACIDSFSFNWDNSMQVQRCLGGGLEIAAILEMMAAGTGSFSMAWADESAKLYEKQFTNELISLVIPLVDTLGNKYELNLPKVEITAPLATGGAKDILKSSFDYKVVEQAPFLTRTPVKTGP